MQSPLTPVLTLRREEQEAAARTLAALRATRDAARRAQARLDAAASSAEARWRAALARPEPAPTAGAAGRWAAFRERLRAEAAHARACAQAHRVGPLAEAGRAFDAALTRLGEAHRRREAVERLEARRAEEARRGQARRAEEAATDAAAARAGAPPGAAGDRNDFNKFPRSFR